MATARPRRTRMSPAAAAAAVLGLLLAACSSDAEGQGSNPDPEQVDAVEVPEVGACRVLTPADVAEAANATRTTDCSEAHTAETFAVGTLPEELHGEEYESPKLGEFAYRECSDRFEKFLGADESTVMRSILSWAWFRPSEEAWEQGARWYRCDVVGGGDQGEEYVELPETAKGLLTPPPKDRWMACAVGATVAGSEKVPCSEPHEWRAVTTIKVDDEDADYPGDRVVEVTTRDYCSDSVGAWLNYPLDYEFGYTWFHEQEWQAGNRRSVCWAKTEQ